MQFFFTDSVHQNFERKKELVLIEMIDKEHIDSIVYILGNAQEVRVFF